jgi:hypothetical protein
MLAHRDHSPNNAGPVIYMELFYPLVLLGLLWLLLRMGKKEATG